MPERPDVHCLPAMQLTTAPHPANHAHEIAITPWYLGATTMATVPWFIRLRWARVAVDVAVIAVALFLPHIDFPLRRMLPMLLGSALLSGWVAVQLSSERPVHAAVATADLLLQTAILTALLELTGGPFNPFAVVYAMPIALAALTIGPPQSALVALASAAGYGLIAYWHLTELAEGHHRLNDFPTHLFTMWLSIALTSELAAYFLVQASNALARREQQLEAMRQQAARTDRLVSLTTLAAGAAHELSTPLGTIALAARELERSATSRGTVPDLAEDARLIRSEVDRCRTILDQMSGRAGGSAVDAPEALSIQAMLADVRARVPREAAGRLVLDVPPDMPLAHLPRAGLTQAVLSLVMNAVDATTPTSDAASLVYVRAVASDGTLSLAVMDSGDGISPDVLKRAGEPFYTTKDPGRGLGLGLFLARVFAERLGGSLVLESSNGTTARLVVPLRASAPEPA